MSSYAHCLKHVPSLFRKESLHRRYVVSVRCFDVHHRRSFQVSRFSSHSWNETSVPSKRTVAVHCSNDDDSSSQRKRPDKPTWTPWSWIARLATHMRLEQLVLLLFNIQLLFFLLRLWPLSGKMGNSNQQTVSITVPFSDFISKVKSNDVDGVQMDGHDMTFTLRPTSKLMKDLPETKEEVKLTYRTVRPADYPTPYETLEQHNVKFSSSEKRGSLLITVMVRSFKNPSFYGFLGLCDLYWIIVDHFWKTSVAFTAKNDWTQTFQYFYIQRYQI